MKNPLADAPSGLAVMATTSCTSDHEAVRSLILAAEHILMRMHDEAVKVPGAAAGKQRQAIELFSAHLRDLHRCVPTGVGCRRCGMSISEACRNDEC